MIKKVANVIVVPKKMCNFVLEITYLNIYETAT